MLRRSHLFLPFAVIAVSACDSRQPDPAPRETASPQAEAAAHQSEVDAERTMASDARIGALTNQVDRLEQSVGELQSTMDNRSTTDARIGALEAKVYTRDPAAPDAGASPAVPKAASSSRPSR